MLMYFLSILGVIVVAGLFTAWLIHEINKSDKPGIRTHKKTLRPH